MLIKYFDELDGQRFEQLVFGTPTEDVPITIQSGFSQSINEVIRNSQPFEKPQTRIGCQLHGRASILLAKNGYVGDLRLISALHTSADFAHETDGLFAFNFGGDDFIIATVDAFYIRSRDIEYLRNLWINSSKDQLYSERSFQADLFRFSRLCSAEIKRGEEANFFRWVKTSEFEEMWHSEYMPSPSYDKETLRPSNHFILTPFHLWTWRRRETFVKNITSSLSRSIQERLTRIYSDTNAGTFA